jgi:hypothetical protein
MMPDDPKKQSSFDEEFLFKSPLYKLFELNLLTGFALSNSMVEGYCPFCGRDSTFSATSDYDFFETGKALRGGEPRFSEIIATCIRSPTTHKIRFFALANERVIQKIGQFPSFADIALDESKAFAKALGGDVSEFHKALGLAAHGVGIGAYVYLRRVFEHLITRRFDENKAANDWDATLFKKMRMEEKIDLLKDHLPKTLIDNANMWKILSLGIHELKEEDCLSFFPVLKSMTMIILMEDKENREKRAERTKLEHAIAKYEAPKSGST